MAIFLKPDDFAETVRVLILLADHPDDVATDTSDGFRLRIPEYLAELYEQYLGVEESAPADVPAPKKRGRPRKIQSTSPDEEQK